MPNTRHLVPSNRLKKKTLPEQVHNVGLANLAELAALGQSGGFRPLTAGASSPHTCGETRARLSLVSR